MPSLIINLGMLQFETFALIFVRASCILFAIPIFGEQGTPLRWRLLFAAVLGLAFSALISPITNVAAFKDVTTFGLAIANEVLLGAVFGFAGRLFFDAIVMAASIVGFQMGFGTADLFVGDSTTAMNSFTALHRTLVMLFFLALNLHHVFLAAIYESLVIAPPGSGFIIDHRFAEHAVTISAAMFPIAVKLAAPVIAALLFTMAVMGVMARAVPQMNVFMMSFPISFFLGLFVYLAMMPLLPGWLKDNFQDSVANLITSLRLLKT